MRECIEERVSARRLAAVPAVLGLVLLLAGAPVSAQQAESLFPQPFLVEHHLEQVDGDGGRFNTEPVLDHYVGDRIISVRADESRVIVDLGQRQVIEIKPASSSYSVLSFDQMVELQRRLRAADRAQVGLEPDQPEVQSEREPQVPEAGEPGFRLTDVPLRDGVDPASLSKSADGRDLLDRPGIRHLRVTLDQLTKSVGETLAVDVWVDPNVRLGAAALTALDRFENEVLTPHATGSVPFARYVAAARKQTGGAFPIRTSRPLSASTTRAGAGSVHDIATRLEMLPEVPEELLEIPDGFQRTVHPLEQMVAFAEEEAELNQRALRGAAN